MQHFNLLLLLVG